MADPVTHPPHYTAGRRFIRWGTAGVGVTARLSYEEAP